jgi:hypothetical protein
MDESFGRSAVVRPAHIISIGVCDSEDVRGHERSSELDVATESCVQTKAKVRKFQPTPKETAAMREADGLKKVITDAMAQEAGKSKLRQERLDELLKLEKEKVCLLKQYVTSRSSRDPLPLLPDLFGSETTQGP